MCVPSMYIIFLFTTTIDKSQTFSNQIF